MNCARARIGHLCAARRATVRVRHFTGCQQWRQQPQTQPVQPAGQAPSRILKTPDQPRMMSRGLINLPIDGSVVDFSTLLLRDMCSCPACVDPSTKQKLFATPEIPLAIDARTFSVTKSGVRIQWKHDIPGWPADHETELSLDVLRNIDRVGHAEPPFYPGPQTIWDAVAFNKLPDMDYEAYMEDDKVLHKAVNQLHTHGLLFLTNVPESENSVSTIGERIGPLKNTFYGYTWDVRSVPEAKNVAYTSQNLGFHMDLMYMKQPPHLQLLHCIRSSAKGGASQFTDSHRAAKDLFEIDSSAFDSLSRLDVTFHYDHPTSNLYRQQRPVIELRKLQSSDKVFDSVGDYVHYRKQIQERQLRGSKYTFSEVDIQGLIDNVSWSPPFQGPFSLHAPTAADASDNDLSRIRLGGKVETWQKAAQKFHELIHRPLGVYERMMGPGECVIFDNRRVLHGRKEFEVGDAGTERWLRGAYLDEDPYMSKLQVLRKRFGDPNSGARS